MKAVYIAPTEALAKERYNEWQKKFLLRFCLSVVELTGETEADFKSLSNGHIIISTPEKWDGLSRRWKKVQTVSLFIVGELHLIGGQVGPILEIIVSRMMRISGLIDSNIRIVALSAPLANAKDLGKWIGATSHGIFNFPPGVRPVPLEIHIQGVDISNFEARMQAMREPTYTSIVQHCKNMEPALVFVPTSKQAMLTALDLCTYSKSGNFLLVLKEAIDIFISEIKDNTVKELLALGVGYLHEGLNNDDKEIVLGLFVARKIQVCVCSSSMCWGKPMPAHLVVVMGTQYDGRENAHTDYSITDLLQMMGHANWPLIDDSGIFVILCHSPRKEYYKKFLYEAFPVESHLPHFLHDHLNAEIVAGVLKNKQDAVDYLTRTFMYLRLKQNPIYYNLHGVSLLPDHLSDLVEKVLSDLESSKFVSIEEDKYLKSLYLGSVASNYYISYHTVERFSSSLTPETTMKDLLDILASASEYAELPIRPGEENLIRNLINNLRFSFENTKCTDPHAKPNALLQAHFSRYTVVGDLVADQQEVLRSAPRLLQAMVDVIASNGWLSLAILAMEVSQMVAQGMWKDDSMLLQLPYFTKELAKRCQENTIAMMRESNDLVDLLLMEENEMSELLQMPHPQLHEIKLFSSTFPCGDLDYEVCDVDDVRPGDNVTLLDIY